MEIAEHIAALRTEGERLAQALERANPDAAVPTCPDWCLRDLVRHLGGVHRWATSYVAEGRTEVHRVDLDDLVGTWPDDGELAGWLRDGLAALAGALESAPPDLECWTFMPAPSPVAFWARRQAHETAIHRADAESATGPMTRYAPAFAADGLDELLLGFAPRPRREKPAGEGTLRLRAPDAGRAWQVAIGPEGIAAAATDAGAAGSGTTAGGTVTGAASDLYLLMWNRRGTGGLEVEGDPAVVDLWAGTHRVTWR